MKSIWSKTVEMRPREKLPGSITADAAVIGGGMAGILTAYQLRRRGIDAVVLEAETVGSGQTKNTTAKVTVQHGLLYDKLIRQQGEGRAAEYARRNREAIDEYQRIIEEKRIDCMWERLPACLYTWQRGSELRAEYEATRRLGIPGELTQVSEGPYRGAEALMFPEQAQFHPLRFLKELSEGVTVYEHTRAIRVRSNMIQTDRGLVSARHIIFATHYPFVNFPGLYFARMHQERSYVLALEGAEKLSAMYYGIDEGDLSLRSAGDVLLAGGASHRTGETKPENAYQELREKAGSFWPGSRVTAQWSAQDCITLDGVPYVGQFSPTRTNWYVATGFQKWGMTGSMVAAMLLGEEIAGQRKGESSIFSPRRFVPKAQLPSFGRDTMKSAKGLLKEVLYFPGKEFDTLAPGQGAVVRWCGKKRGAYKDRDGAVYLVSTRCPHLGCQLEWNQNELSWDCPCHGSRFDFRGNLIDNPAQAGLKNTMKQ